LSAGGVPPHKQGGLYWWQEQSIWNEHFDSRKFNASLAGAKIN